MAEDQTEAYQPPTVVAQTESGGVTLGLTAKQAEIMVGAGSGLQVVDSKPVVSEVPAGQSSKPAATNP